MADQVEASFPAQEGSAKDSGSSGTPGNAAFGAATKVIKEDQKNVWAAPVLAHNKTNNLKVCQFSEKRQSPIWTA